MPARVSSSARSAEPVDGTDRAILAALAADGRMSNTALAARVGVAESTCLQRVRSLTERGVIRGFHADLDLTALGLPLQAVVKVQLGSHNRDHVNSFHAILAGIPGAVRILHVAGEDDYLVHVAVATAEELRDLVLEHINVHPAVRHTETQLVFEVIQGAGPGLAPGRARRTS